MDNRKLFTSLAGIITAAILFCSSGINLPFFDNKTDAYFQEAISKAGVTYAVCRIINGSVSVIKESDLQLEPGGIGISLAIGQILDPIDDMTERLSDVLVTAITSLGIQKLAYEISVSLVPPILAICLFVLSVFIWFKNDRLKSLQKITLRFAILVIMARLCLPISSVANELLHRHFFSDQIAEAKQELSLNSAGLYKLKEFSLPETDGVLDTIKNSSSFLKQKAGELKDAMKVLAGNMEKIVENLLKLTFLYVGVFLIQVVVLPIALFWILVKTANALFLTSIPVIINDPLAITQKENIRQ